MTDKFQPQVEMIFHRLCNESLTDSYKIKIAGGGEFNVSHNNSKKKVGEPAINSLRRLAELHLDRDPAIIDREIHVYIARAIEKQGTAITSHASTIEFVAEHVAQAMSDSLKQPDISNKTTAAQTIFNVLEKSYQDQLIQIASLNPSLRELRRVKKETGYGISPETLVVTAIQNALESNKDKQFMTMPDEELYKIIANELQAMDKRMHKIFQREDNKKGPQR